MSDLLKKNTVEDDFKIVGKDLIESEKISKPSMSFWSDVVRRIKTNKVAVVSFWIIVFLMIMAIAPTVMTASTICSVSNSSPARIVKCLRPLKMAPLPSFVIKSEKAQLLSSVALSGAMPRISAASGCPNRSKPISSQISSMASAFPQPPQ